MASTTIDGYALLGTSLQSLLMADSIVPGSKPSYELCKTIYTAHPHGAKIADNPVLMAMYKPRQITVPKAPDDGLALVEAFQQQWREDRCDRLVFNAARLARVYGVATLGVLVDQQAADQPLDYKTLAGSRISYNVWDPLNTAGSLVLNQDPNAMDFQKSAGVRVNGLEYHRSRVCVIQNEDPLYIEYEPSGYGFLGRSVYQRALVPLKSFVLTLATDMMVALKAGVLITKMQSPSSAVDGIMANLFGQKRQMVKEAQTGNVLTISPDEEIESLNLQNLDGAYGMARKNIIENEAAASGTPAKILLSETFAEGFGEGSEDAKAIAQYVDSIRMWLQPLYDFLDQATMYRAWNEEFYAVIQQRYPEEYAGVPYAAAFAEWRNSFTAQWPNLLDEPDSEKLKGEDIILKAVCSVFEMLSPDLPPDQRAMLVEWVMDNLNEKKRLFTSPLQLDTQAIAEYELPVAAFGQSPQPEHLADSQPVRARRAPRVPQVADEPDAEDKALRNKVMALMRGQATAL